MDPTKMKARQFRATAAPAVPSSASNLWTETPAERQQRIADEVSGKKKRAANADDAPADGQDEQARRVKQKMDEEIRREVEAHTVRPFPLFLSLFA